MSQPNLDHHPLPAPTSPSTSVSSYLARMESAINPAASANVDHLATQVSMTLSHEKHNVVHRHNDTKDMPSSVMVDDHSFNDRADEDDGAMVLHRSVESLDSAGYLSTVHDDSHRQHQAIDRSDVEPLYPSSAQIMAAVRDSGHRTTVGQQITPPTWVS